ncbi:MAG: hypothetical protein ABI402_17585 [Ferruginibacter sp.]
MQEGCQISEAVMKEALQISLLGEQYNSVGRLRFVPLGTFGTIAAVILHQTFLMERKSSMIFYFYPRNVPTEHELYNIEFRF